ncbi:hypothetical protein ALTERO38_20312 [Alteromonas sp. 38]|nr:hypothetical protein ALTER154_100226 [Alteromonas sp. 154]VXB05490.1 hypothetical protein ALTERO38_20312 [Alteromonas sp. 38]
MSQDASVAVGRLRTLSGHWHIDNRAATKSDHQSFDLPQSNDCLAQNCGRSYLLYIGYFIEFQFVEPVTL